MWVLMWVSQIREALRYGALWLAGRTELFLDLDGCTLDRLVYVVVAQPMSVSQLVFLRQRTRPQRTFRHQRRGGPY